MRSGFSTLTLAYWIDSLVRVSRRDGKSHFSKIALRPLKLLYGFANGFLPGRRCFPLVYSQRQTSFCFLHKKTTQLLSVYQTQPIEELKPGKEKEAKLASYTNNYPFTTSFSTVSSLLTLFSKFFSPFLRSTCSLSVSHKYLALEEVYLPFRAAIPNNPTLRKHSLDPWVANYGVFTLYDVLFQETYAIHIPSEYLSRLQFLNFVPRIFNVSFCLFTRRYWGNPS